jgi:hypothetical protein
MATALIKPSEIIVNELLCYANEHFSKVSANQLKASLVKFYNEHELVSAKNMLILYADKALDNSLSRYAKRTGDLKAKLTADDIYDVLSVVDEKKVMDKMPIFAAVNLTRIPLFRAEDMDIFSLAIKLDAIEAKVTALSTGSQPINPVLEKLDSIDAKLQALERPVTRLPVVSAALVGGSTVDVASTDLSTGAPVSTQTAVGVSVSADRADTRSGVRRHSALGVSTAENPTADNRAVGRTAVRLSMAVNSIADNRSAGRPTLGDSTAANSIEDTRPLGQSYANVASASSGENQFVTVTRRRSSHAQLISSASNNTNGRVLGTSNEGLRSTVDGRKNQIFGTRNVTNSTIIKPGVTILRKVVMHVDNIDVGCSAGDLTKYLKDNHIDVLSCYSAKSWLKESDQGSVAAFRVCINLKSRPRFEAPFLWPEGVILREWVFKSNRNGANV